jgi:nucleoside-diphosphate-sugar epimerase
MNILVIGGSYFFGKAFVGEALKKGHKLTLVNRGTRSACIDGLANAENFKLIKGDRHDPGLWKNIENYDVIVDFCGYAEGDIALVTDNIKKLPEHYIFISTVDVFRRQMNCVKDETALYEDRLTKDMGQEAEYILGKIVLEQELISKCRENGMAYTILRPAILYGPGNYAPRENLYLRYMKEAKILPEVCGAAGKFQMVYVEDAAKAVLLSVEKEAARNQTFNICPQQTVGYEDFFDALKSVWNDLEYQEIHMSPESAMSQGAPLPFPVFENETEIYSGEKSERILGVEYVSLLEGLRRTRQLSGE